MKYKFLSIIILLLAIFRLNSMESQLNLDKSPLWQQLPTELKAKVLRHAVWYTLPPELKVYIISYIAQANCVEDIIKNLKIVSLVSKEFHSFTQFLISEFTKSYIEQYPELAYAEFFEAAKKNKLLVIRALINAGINVNSQDSVCNTALKYAAENGNKEVVQLLLNSDADTNIKVYNGEIALIGAVYQGYTNIVELLINAGSDVNNKDDLYEWTALMLASSRGHREIVQMLLNAGADTDAETIFGNTALSYAIRMKHSRIADLLASKNMGAATKKRKTE